MDGPLPRAPSPASAETAAVQLAGRVGHAHCINGDYVLAPELPSSGDCPVYRNTRVIPEGFGESSGRHLYL